MINVDRTLISQYANAPTMRALVRNMDSYVDPRADLDLFYNFVWNVETAQGFGLDIWGRIVAISRELTFIDKEEFFGFQPDFRPFNDAVFYGGHNSTSTYTLSDELYRRLILAKALANISATTAPAINQLLQNIFGQAGGEYVADGYVMPGYVDSVIGRRVYVAETGPMSISYVFEFELQPYELAILTNTTAVPRPAGVQVNIVEIGSIQDCFGFKEQGAVAPFDQGVFRSASLRLA